MIKKLLNTIRKNKLYTALFIFIVLINVAAFIHSRSIDEGPANITSGTSVESEEEDPRDTGLFYDSDAKERQEKLLKLFEEKPALSLFMAFFNLMALFALFVGILFDIYLILRKTNRDPLRIRILDQDEPGWGVRDVIKVTLIFISFGYLFAMIQGALIDIIPILKNNNFTMVFNTAVMNIGGISVIFYFVVKKYGQPVTDIGITSRELFKSAWYAVSGYVALIPIVVVIMIATLIVTKLINYKPPVQPIVQVFLEEERTSILGFSVLFAAIFGPIAEEIFFRGFMYPALRKNIGVVGAIFTTSAIFAFLHAHIVGFLPILALGVLLTYLYQKTGSIVPSIFVHIMHNVVMVILVFIMKYAGTM